MKKPVIAGLYVITTPPQRGETLAAWLARCEAAMRGGAQLMQYRDKTATPAQRQRRASALLERCRAHKVPLLINDDVALARSLGADGVHLGRDDCDIQRARSELGPDAVIGQSCYNRLPLALEAQSAGADYVAFGAAFPSPTKLRAVHAPLALYAEAKSRLKIPVVAIGGICARNAGRLAEAGVDAIAVISAVTQAPDPARAAQELLAAFVGSTG